ncbi:MAG: hypothetical protein COA99_04855 [Moraxellaceae bacterium]|nr:MAG: hypothetical protein COA99_04855 [Moraxellaceae bacterium]
MSYVDQLISVFSRFLEQEEELLLLLTLHLFTHSHTQWQFELPKLHQFLLDTALPSTPVNYKEFRHWLFNSPINQRLDELGAEIAIHNNQHNVNLTTYILRYQQPK